MKKLIMALAALLLLSGMAACGITISSSPEEGLPASGTNTALMGKLQEKTDTDFTFSKTTDNLKTECDYLTSLGISAQIQNAVVQDTKTCSFQLLLESSEGKTLILPLSGHLYYESKEGEITYYRGEWGSINIPREGVLAVCCQNTVTLIDLSTLTVMDFAPKLSEGCLPVGIVWQEGLGYMVPCTDLSTSWIFIFDETGGCVRQVSAFGSIYYTPFVTENALWGNYPSYCPTPEVITYDKPYLKVWSSYYDLENGASFDLTNLNSITDGSSRVVLCGYHNNAQETDGLTYAAILYQNDTFTDWLLFRNEEIDNLYDEFTGSIDPVTGEASLFCDASGMYLTLDFAGQKHTVRHEPQEKHLADPIAASADGAYTLWSANAQSGGDAYYYNIVLRDNGSGRLTYIAPSGGMWGGFGDVGFLRNNDFYVMTDSSMKIYSPQSGECTFTLNDRFPLGEISEESIQRILFAFRRDPVDYSFIVVYAEAPLEHEADWGEEVSENNQYYTRYPFHYRVGRCDSTGALLESWDTGKCVIADMFGLSSIELRLSGDQLTLTGSASKAHGKFSGVFDLTRHTYTDNGFLQG